MLFIRTKTQSAYYYYISMSFDVHYQLKHLLLFSCVRLSLSALKKHFWEAHIH